MTNLHSVLTFDGINDYVEFFSNATLNLTDNFTIEAWIKPKTLGQRIVDKNIGGHNEGFTFDTYPQNLRFINKGIGFTSRNSLKIGTWQHVAVTFKHEANGAKLYINGEEDNTATPNQIGTVTNLPMRLGSQADTLGNLFKGEMAEVRIWNCVRTPAEIQQNMHRRLKGSESGLVGYWPLDEGSGETVGDRSANSNNGTVHGATWETTEVPIQPSTPQQPKLLKQGPKGSNVEGNSFDIRPPKNLVHPRIQRIYLVHAWAISDIQVSYEASNSTTLPGESFILEPEDYLTKILGTWGRQAPGYPKEEIITLQFQTHKGIVSKIFGGGSGTQEVESFSLEAPEGQEIIGFFGIRGGRQNLLLSLGAYLRSEAVSFSNQQFQGTGLADYGYWYHWEKNLPKPTEKKPFRRGRIWA